MRSDRKPLILSVLLVLSLALFLTACQNDQKDEEGKFKPTPSPGEVDIYGDPKPCKDDSSPNTWSGNAQAGNTFARVIVKEYLEGP